MGCSKSQGGLGFRDLLCFNKALLAKQVWRILQNPHSLAARILKAKYFPRDSVMKAPLCKRPSFAWRSICSARDLLQEGLLWRIGDGKSVNIWKDKWLPIPRTYSVQSPRRLLAAEASVGELIDPDTKWWNAPLIKEIFSETKAEIICNIPLSRYMQKDVEIW
ncbi:hypothetical protein SLA2020_335190 [Shorea laevis]